MSLSRLSQVTPAEQRALDLVQNQEAVVSVVFVRNPSTNELDFSYVDAKYLDQLINPTLNRPSRSAELYADKVYDFGFMTSSPNIKKNTIEFKATDKGLTYRLIGLDSKLKTDIIAWDQLPFDFPREDQKIIQQFTYEMYLEIISHTSKAGYTLERGLPRPPVLKKVDLRTFKVHDHKPGLNRETKHKSEDFQFTAKTATTLLPTDPTCIELWNGDEGRVAFLWNINKCNLKKEKYVFVRDAVTDDSFWLLEEGTEEELIELKERMAEVPLTTVSELRKLNEKTVSEKSKLLWNELDVGLPKAWMDAVVATQDLRDVRLDAYRTMLHIKEKFNMSEDLPILVIQCFRSKEQDGEYTPEGQPVVERPGVYRVYSAAEIAEDLKVELAEKQAANVQTKKSEAANTLLQQRRVAQAKKKFFKPKEKFVLVDKDVKQEEVAKLGCNIM